jgi:S-adenosylmethionine/arginine decarboxylase-like enzyme
MTGPPKVDSYGKELILDLHSCDSSRFTRKHIRNYFKKVCDLIDMERCKLSWWDDLHTPEREKETEPHLVGTSAVQFIKTSNITIHTLDIMKRAYVNIFSCKDFDHLAAARFTREWFAGEIVNKKVIERV